MYNLSHVKDFGFRSLIRDQFAPARAVATGSTAVRSASGPDGDLSVGAPDAVDVKLSGDFLPAAQALKKGADGTWSITVGPSIPPSMNTRIR